MFPKLIIRYMIIINLSYILNIVVILFLIGVLGVAFIATNIICAQKHKFMIFTTQCDSPAFWQTYLSNPVRTAIILFFY